jgi:hypothetical protein
MHGEGSRIAMLVWSVLQMSWSLHAGSAIDRSKEVAVQLSKQF